MNLTGIIILAVIMVLLVCALIMIRVYNKLSIKKMVSEGKYIDLDEAFIRRYQKLPEFLELCENTERVANERQLCIDATRAEERVEHDKLMAEALAEVCEANRDKLESGRGAELKQEFDAIAEEIANDYAAYNEATKEYEKLRNKAFFKPAVKFFNFEAKPLF